MGDGPIKIPVKRQDFSPPSAFYAPQKLWLPTADLKPRRFNRFVFRPTWFQFFPHFLVVMMSVNLAQIETEPPARR